MEPIVSTPNHPYYILDVDSNTPIINFEGLNNSEYRGQWVNAGDLKAGMKVLLSNGKNGIIRSLTKEELVEPMATYNF